MDRDELHAYAEEIGIFFEREGLPRMEGRVLGWLMVCDPPEQSADDLAAALGASRGAISMATRMLHDAGAVERRKVPGTRRLTYRLRPGFWLGEAESKARVARDWRALMGRGLELMHEESDERRQRVHEAHEMFTFLEREYSAIERRWRGHLGQQQRAGGDDDTTSTSNETSEES